MSSHDQTQRIPLALIPQIWRWRLWLGVLLGIAIALGLHLSAYSQALPAPPAVAPSLDTSTLLTPGNEGSQPLPTQPLPGVNVPPLPNTESALPTGTAQTDTLDGRATSEITVGREIVIEKSDAGLSETDIPVVMMERSSGKKITITPGQGIKIEDPKAPMAPPPPPFTAPTQETLLYPLPTAVPISSPFGMRTHPISGLQEFHQGVDLAASMGTPVLAAFSGSVLSAGSLGGLGNAVVLGHSATQRTRYGHMDTVAVTAGQTVRQGSVIGYVGSTGESTGPHLHFELWQRSPSTDWVALDAAPQLKLAVAQLP
ncbi:MAG: M23 family metallopeptidase [Cyanobacteriota bacterium]|nr:M23 family metallopeptidase [Cyanobacteriota bacterium]